MRVENPNQCQVGKARLSPPMITLDNLVVWRMPELSIHISILFTGSASTMVGNMFVLLWEYDANLWAPVPSHFKSLEIFKSPGENQLKLTLDNHIPVFLPCVLIFAASSMFPAKHSDQMSTLVSLV